MNKRITSLLLCFVMVFVMLATAVPALAAPIESTQLKVIPDKTKASPGDIITYTIVMGPVSDMGSMQMVLDIPTGLTYVENSTTLAANLKTTLGFDLLDWTEVSKMINGGASAADYESATDTELAKFQCKVDDGATGSLEVGLTNLEFGSCQTFEYHTDRFSVAKTPVTIAAEEKPATGITLNKSELTLTAGDSDTSLTATVTPEGSTDTVVWSSSKTDVATVDSATGKVTAVAPGEATITATAGTKTATCTVKVQAAPCNHASCTPVPAKDSNCTEKGWDAYKKCDQCGKLFDMNGNPLAEIPYRDLNDDHDFITTAWGYKEADGHAHVCSRNAAHHDEVRPHTPDHQGGATYDYAVKGTECGRVLEPQREHGTIRIEVPFKLTVKKTGEMAPGQETFKFAVEKFGAPTTYTVVQDTVETNGEKTYEGKFIFTIRDDQAGNLSEGFVIRQVKGNAAGWTYDETKFYAIPVFVDSYESVGAWSFCKFDENNELDYNNPIREIGFTNSFNAKMPVTPPAPETPKTGDGSMMGLSIALVIVSGAALMGTALYSRRKSR